MQTDVRNDQSFQTLWKAEKRYIGGPEETPGC